MIIASVASVLLFLASILSLYECLRLTYDYLPGLRAPLYLRVVFIALAILFAHVVAVVLYAAAYWVLAIKFQIGGFAGVPITDFLDCFYYSAVTYTSLGFGEHYPVSHMRVISGMEALNGLLAIGWSASFAYLVMQRFWPLHKTRRKRRR